MNGQREKLVTQVLIAALLVSTIGVIYFSATAQESTDPYTELYVLGPNGNASDYPKDLSVGESGTLIVGISNHEHQAKQYTLVYRLGGEEIDTETIAIERGETVEKEYSFTPESAGDKRLQILLYQGDEASSDAEPYRSVYLWISVRNQQDNTESSDVSSLHRITYT